MSQKRKHKKKHEREIEKTVDTAQRVIQGIALIALVVLIVVDYVTPNTNVEVWIKGGLLAVGIGLSPKQILDIARNFIGAKK